MERKNLEFEHIYDIRAVRVLVEEMAQCYTVLGIVHNLWSYVRGEFDDYITTPKENGYRSLHTAVIGPDGKTVEVQIRTYDMHESAELGVAAHWRYKEGAHYDPNFERKVAWLRQVLEWKEEVSDAGDFVDQFKSDMLQDRVYVLTPAGKIIDLPMGASPIDFAYHIHSEIGHRCRGAEVNGRIVPLNYQLQNGEQVKILTVKHGGPSRDWLNPHLGYIQTSRARSHIQRWFKLQNYTQNASEGRVQLEKELSRLGMSDVRLEKLAQRFRFNTVDDFMAAIGRNDLKISQVVGALQEHEVQQPTVRRTHRGELPPAEYGTDIQVQGVGDLLTKVARCCKPVPGDAILGYITRGQGVSIHRHDCPNILRFIEQHSDRLIEVDWAPVAKNIYTVDILVEAFDRTGLLRDVISVVSNEGINVMATNTYTNPKTNYARLLLTLEITSINQLSRVLAKIGQLPNVTEARRRTSG
jgi:GTP pyrophosphokinase